jgi:hypothetical protein
MGYYVDMDMHGVRIDRENIPRCLSLINKLHEPDPREGGVRTYSWVDSPPKGGWTDIRIAMSAWRYDAELDDEGNLLVWGFSGEKLGDDEILWEQIAASINPGALIECRGEDGCIWAWKIDDQGFCEGDGEITYRWFE